MGVSMNRSRDCQNAQVAHKLTPQRTVTNVVPSSMTLTLQIFREAEILSQIRQGLAESVEPGTRVRFDWKKLERNPLLLSMYAETLRFGVQIHIPRTSPHRQYSIGNLFVPKNKLMLISTWLAHTDVTVWNTKQDNFPLSDFWAQRFLVDPKDPSSGPTKRRLPSYQRTEANGVHFSTAGLEGAWIPYGGMMSTPS